MLLYNFMHISKTVILNYIILTKFFKSTATTLALFTLLLIRQNKNLTKPNPLLTKKLFLQNYLPKHP